MISVKSSIFGVWEEQNAVQEEWWEFLRKGCERGAKGVRKG
jgi:hypothetical protein